MYKLNVGSKKKYQEEYEFDKKIRLIALKMIQVIVQSRLGNKLRTYCKPICYVNDYFGIAINDVPDVLTEAKRVLENNLIIHRLPLSVEISLKTADGNSLVLENWMLGLNFNEVGPDVNSTENFYNKISLLLRSLLSTTRILPAYKISRNQDSSDYTIYYRLHMGNYDHTVLGDGYKQFDFGKITCLKGTLYLQVKYRTNMVMSTEKKIKTIDINCKSIERPKRDVDLTKPMKMGAFVDIDKIKEFQDDRFVLPEDPPCSWLLDLAQGKYDCKHMKIGPVEETKIVEENQPQDEAASKPPEANKQIVPVKKEKDIFSKPLNCAFATSTPLAELAGFFREFWRAPSLHSLSLSDDASEECPSCQNPENDVSKQLEKLEESLEDYDRMVSDLCQFSNEYI